MCCYVHTSCHHLDRKEALVAMLWLCLMAIFAERRGGRRPLCEVSKFPYLQSFHCKADPAIGHPHIQNKEGKRADDFCSPASTTPILLDPSEVTLFIRVEGERATSAKSTPARNKNKRPGKSPKPSKKKLKPTSDDLKSLDEKWFQRFAQLEAMLLLKSFAVLVEPVKKPVEGERATSAKSTPTRKKNKRPGKSPKPSKKKRKPTSDDLKSLDEKWFQRFAQLEAMLLLKSFAVLVEPVKKPATVVTSDQPFLIQEPVPARCLPVLPLK